MYLISQTQLQLRSIFSGYIKQIGSPIALELMKRKLFKSELETISSDPSGSQHMQRKMSIGGEVNGSLPIKSGWLLKKRDIIFGWQCRYFVVYVGRVEVYTTLYSPPLTAAFA